ncbi:MAG: DNA polymerase III subunit alpha [Candidatus Parcubacteria bacterium]|nr:DNA polymerase III subunit alpha [Candidatus Parcubacteria bacterium]
MKFVPLHVHSHYSLLDGLAKIDDLVAKAKADGIEAMALTDHGSMYGIIEFCQKAKKAGVKPIIGVEAYVAPYGRKNKRTKIDEDRYHLILLAKNNIGYQNLLKLVTSAYLDGFYYKPRIDLEILEKYKEGIIGLSACIEGEIPNAILTYKDLEKAEAVLQKYLNIFGRENFFLELQSHPNMPVQKQVNEKLLELARKNNVDVVATNDTHYLNTEDDKAHDILICIQTNRKVTEENRMTMMGEDFSLKTTEHMYREFKFCPEAVSNTQKVADLCNVEIPFGKNILPVFEVPAGYTDIDYLRKLCMEGLVYRYGGQLDKDNNWSIEEDKILSKNLNQEFRKKDVQDRLDYELSIIAKTGFSSYFLIVADFIIWAKNNGIVVGPGRGSAAGSLVSYLTRITNLDPLAYDLLFERFLNPDRISMPDIDTDFADVRRDEVIRYVEDKYGKDHVAQIVTFGTMAARAAIRDVGRALGLAYSYCDKVAKMIPLAMDLNTALGKVPDLKAEYKNNKDCKDLLDNARKLEGCCRHASTHACGIVITPKPLTEYLPLQYASSDDISIVSQYSLHPIEDLGLLKMDFLGLRNLTIVENALETIEKVHAIKINIENIPLDDKKSFALLQKGETTGVFQLESSGMKRYLKQLKPSSIEDIIAMVALYRPGPLNSGMVDEFIARKHGVKKSTYDHPLMEKSLNKTYGVIVYQEQVMQLSKDMAGFTGGQADTLRKAMGKKIADLMEKMKKDFIEGCLRNNIPKDIAQKTFSSMEKFAEYGFNKSHAACYAWIAYETAYLKANYPVEFMASLLTSDLDDIERIALEVGECRNMGIEVLPPDINESFTRFTVVAESLKEKRPRIRFGLSAVKNVGMNLTKAIIRERKEKGSFQSLVDFLSRINDKDLNKKSLESLIKCGALDQFGDRYEMLMNMDKLLNFIRAVNEEAQTSQNSLFATADNKINHSLQLEKFSQTPKKEKLAWEKELLGLYISEHPFSDFQNELDGYILSSVNVKKGLGAGLGNIRIGGVINSIKKIITQKGEAMLFVKIEDTYDSIEAIVFPSVYSATKDDWVEDNIVIISGTLSNKDGDYKIICNEVKTLTAGIINDLKNRLKKINLKVTKEAKDLYIFFKKVITADSIVKLNKILNSNNGKNKVFLAVPIDDQRFRKIETNFYADFDNAELQKELSSLIEVRFVKLM